jgi:hypothetical protein
VCLLERGIAVRQGLRFLRAELPRILATPVEVLSPRMVRIIRDLAEDWRRLDERIDHLSNEIAVLAQQDTGCERLMSVPGIDPIISSAMVAAIDWMTDAVRAVTAGGSEDIQASGRHVATYFDRQRQVFAAVRGAKPLHQGDFPAWGISEKRRIISLQRNLWSHGPTTDQRTRYDQRRALAPLQEPA